ncbi:SDR family oxidoreductase [Rhizobium cauense]|uniref:SDR family oxidoreductase n=1 Tax=Rhizobium cauense TaxID=1166683 RepID=UPI001C6ECB11|nr:SDR family oxidoreductase [Rhizobium cauense]MBW9116356.1 SDR family oxidoreductase [Rhizobium cauense]
MNILVTGANGLIGSSICGRLLQDGHQVVAVVRPGGLAPFGATKTVYLDVASAVDVQAWVPILENVHAVVNCVGALQDSPREDVAGIHVAGPAALFQACEQLGVRRVVHFSAIGVDRQQPSQFSETKFRGDDVVMARDLDWVILRPSVVLGRPAFGASALIRGLAALPVLPVMPGGGELQVVQLDDVVETVVKLLEPNAARQVILEMAGPQRLAFEEVVRIYRRWLGRRPAVQLPVPSIVASLLYSLGDLAGVLGWRPALRTTAKKEIARGATGDPQPWAATVGIQPRSLAEALKSAPANVQERWFSNLFFLKPLIFVVLPLFWIVTGIISVTVGFDEGLALMNRGNAGVLAVPSVVAGALADITIGIMIAFRRTSRLGLWGAVLVSIFYAIAGTILIPALWHEPLGPLLKIGPILVLHLVAFAILEER